MFSNEFLEHCKKEINLAEFAVSEFGYEVDQKYRHGIKLRRGADIVVVSLNRQNGHHRYFSVVDDRDNGSIIDFIQRRDPRATLGHVRRLLSRYINSARQPMPGQQKIRIEPSEPDRDQVKIRLSHMKIARRHPYLEGERHIAKETLNDPRFQGESRIRIDGRGNAIFPHRDEDGWCGYEIKNKGFTGYAPNGIKTLWRSAAKITDTGMIVAESGIDALSHFELFRPEHTAYFSMGGAWSSGGKEYLRRCAKWMCEQQQGRGGLDVILAVDNDAAGDKYVQTCKEEIFQGLPARVIEHRPPDRGQDWNDVLKVVKRGEIALENLPQLCRER